jgi:hypothetical protein
MELKKLLSLLGNERGCGPFERSGEKAPIDEGSSDARSTRRIFSRYWRTSWKKVQVQEDAEITNFHDGT